MRANDSPTKEQWQELYQAAIDFKQAEPWTWLYDDDVFCLENPKDKTIGYCSVMGKGGMHFALGVYLGNAGFENFYKLLTESEAMPPYQVLHYHNCLMCSFEDRDLLTNVDRNQIKALGRTFRGRNAWPLFRRYEPGYAPWYINRDECVFLTQALRQSLITAINIRENLYRMDDAKGKTILRYSQENNGQLEWYPREFKLLVPKYIYKPLIFKDDMVIHKIKKIGSMGDVVFQLDSCYMPTPIRENKDERPYYPKAFLLVDKKTGLVIDYGMYASIQDEATVVLNKLINMFLGKGTPREIQVRSDFMVSLLTDFCEKTGINLKKVRKLVAINKVLKEMGNYF